MGAFMKAWISLSSIFLCLAVVAGAFGAHALKHKMDPYLMTVYEKAVLYQVIHSFGIFFVAILPALSFLSEQVAIRICAVFLVGICIFSGSLYALTLSGILRLGMITPLGGAALIVGWLYLAIAVYRGR